MPVTTELADKLANVVTDYLADKGIDEDSDIAADLHCSLAFIIDELEFEDGAFDSLTEGFINTYSEDHPELRDKLLAAI